MAANFPKYPTHETASCFNCEGDLDGSHWSESGHARGRGEFVQSCEKCRMSTWYDLAPRKYADKHSDEWTTGPA